MSAITLQDFLDNFTVRVVEYKTEQNSTITVHFEVRCNANNRLSIHITSVDVSELPGGYTSQDVLDLGWSQVTENVSDWATTNVVNPPLTTFTPLTSTNDISLTDLNTNFSIRLARWELYPRERPSTWCVGLEITKTVGGKSKIMDCAIPFTSLCNNTQCLDIVTAAWDVMKPSLCAWAAEVLPELNVVNTTYTPTSLT